MAVFNLTNAEVVKFTALSEFLRCFIAFLTYVIYMKYDFAKKLNSRKVSFMAIVGFLIYHLITYSWPFLPGKLNMYSNDGINNSYNFHSLVLFKCF